MVAHLCECNEFSPHIRSIRNWRWVNSIGMMSKDQDFCQNLSGQCYGINENFTNFYPDLGMDFQGSCNVILYIGTVLVATVLDKRGHLGKKHSRNYDSIITCNKPCIQGDMEVSGRVRVKTEDIEDTAQSHSSGVITIPLPRTPAISEKVPNIGFLEFLDASSQFCPARMIPGLPPFSKIYRTPDPYFSPRIVRI